MNKDKLNIALTSVLKAVAYFLIYFIASLVISSIFSLAIGITATTVQEFEKKILEASLEITMISNAFAILGCCLFMKLFKEVPAEALRINTGFGAKSKVLYMSLLLGLSGQFAITVILAFIPFPQSWIDLLGENGDMIISNPILTQIVAVAIVAPLAEEIIFRGCIQRTLSEGLPKWVAIIATSVVFGVMHANPIGIIYATVLGVLMGWLFAEFDSIVPSFLFHLAFNATSLFVSESMPVILFIGALVIFIICIIYLARLSKLPRANDNNFSEGDNNNEAL